MKHSHMAANKIAERIRVECGYLTTWANAVVAIGQKGPGGFDVRFKRQGFIRVLDAGGFACEDFVPPECAEIAAEEWEAPK